MRCPACRSTAVRERPERTTQDHRRFRCNTCGKQFNERSGGLLNRAQCPSDVIAPVVLWRPRCKLSLRDLAEMFLLRGFVFTHEAVREWGAKLTPALAEDLRRRRKGKVGRGWHVDETCIRVRGRWKCLDRAIDRAVHFRHGANLRSVVHQSRRRCVMRPAPPGRGVPRPVAEPPDPTQQARHAAAPKREAPATLWSPSLAIRRAARAAPAGLPCPGRTSLRK